VTKDAAAPLQGLFAEVHTPFGASGRFNGAAIVKQYELLVTSEVDGVFLCGTAGEGYSLTLAERRAVLESWVGVTEGAMPLIAHVGHNCIRDAVELASHARMAGATAVAAMAPSYHRPSSLEELVEFLAPIAEAAGDLPFLFYEAPDFTGVRFATDQLLEWGKLRIPNLAGVKYTSGDMATLVRAMQSASDLAVLLGYEELLLPALAAGVTGAVGLSFSFAAPVYRRIIAAFDAGDLERARAEQSKAIDLARVLQEFGVVRASKAIMALSGVDCGTVRSPLRPLTAHELASLYERVSAMDLFARPLASPSQIVG
jgi:N-acetylneuraminate lyase